MEKNLKLSMGRQKPAGESGLVFLGVLRRDKLALGAVMVFGAMLVMAMIGQFVIEEVTVLELARMNRPPSPEFWLGTDFMGRDLFHRLILAFGNSMGAAMLATTFSTVIGLLVGALGGYYGGTFDRVVTWFMDLLGIAPSFILTLALFSVFASTSAWQVAWIISLTSWPMVARLIRSKTLQEREMDYVHASITVGTSKWKILWEQIFPQLVPVLVAGFFLNLGVSIGVETGASYLGLGFAHEVPSIGGMIAQGGSITMLFARPWVWLPPALATLVFMLSAHYIGQFLIRLGSPGLGD